MNYLDGGLPPDQHSEFERHLAVCPACILYLDSYKKTIQSGKDACREVELVPIPPDLVNAILAARAV